MGLRQTSNTINANTAAELAGLLDERELIKEIMRMIGALRARWRDVGPRGWEDGHVCPA